MPGINLLISKCETSGAAIQLVRNTSLKLDAILIAVFTVRIQTL